MIRVSFSLFLSLSVFLLFYVIIIFYENYFIIIIIYNFFSRKLLLFFHVPGFIDARWQLRFQIYLYILVCVMSREFTRDSVTKFLPAQFP